MDKENMIELLEDFIDFLKDKEDEKKEEKVVDVIEDKEEMVKSKELLSLTGYIHGGCSPIGMKKSFKTVIDSSVRNYDKLIFSGGKIGYQVETTLDELKKVINFDLKDIT